MSIEFSAAELASMFEGGGPRTADDVSITTDGRRLDSKEAVLEFLAELEVERAATRQADGADDRPTTAPPRVSRLVWARRLSRRTRR